MAILRGHSRPVKIESLEYVLDHTYVTCGAGHCWPCWGDCLDGVVLKTGEGSSSRADEIAKPESHAGIFYGIEGLCHQTSNRILWPAGINVSEATGYGITHFFFGTFGNDASRWKAHLDASSEFSGEISDCQGPESPVLDPPSAADGTLFTAIATEYEHAAARAETEDSTIPTPDPALLARLLKQRVEEVLVSDYSAARIEAMQRVQRSSIEDKTEIDSALLGGRISGVEFAHAANRRINAALRDLTRIVPDPDYIALFQMRPGAWITVIRPDICREVYDRVGSQV